MIKTIRFFSPLQCLPFFTFPSSPPSFSCLLSPWKFLGTLLHHCNKLRGRTWNYCPLKCIKLFIKQFAMPVTKLQWASQPDTSLVQKDSWQPYAAAMLSLTVVDAWNLGEINAIIDMKVQLLWDVISLYLWVPSRKSGRPFLLSLVKGVAMWYKSIF